MMHQACPPPRQRCGSGGRAGCAVASVQIWAWSDHASLPGTETAAAAGSHRNAISFAELPSCLEMETKQRNTASCLQQVGRRLAGRLSVKIHSSASLKQARGVQRVATSLVLSGAAVRSLWLSPPSGLGDSCKRRSPRTSQQQPKEVLGGSQRAKKGLRSRRRRNNKHWSFPLAGKRARHSPYAAPSIIRLDSISNVP